MDLRSTRHLLEHRLGLLHETERLILAELPRLVEMVSDDPLRTSLQEHLTVTEDHRRRLEVAASEMGITLAEGHVPAVSALIDEAGTTARAAEGEAVRDAAIIAGVQAVEHYEIAGYGTALAYARMLGEEDLQSMLGRTLEEEREADRALSGIAESFLNDAAAQAPQETR
jgi:ferritin-like metal-binding protein YciE